MACGRKRGVIQLLLHARAVHLLEWWCREFEVNNFCGISVSGNWKIWVSTVWERGHQPLCSFLRTQSQGLTHGGSGGMETTLRGGVPSNSMVMKWDAEFKCRRDRRMHKGMCCPFPLRQCRLAIFIYLKQNLVTLSMKPVSAMHYNTLRGCAFPMLYAVAPNQSCQFQLLDTQRCIGCSHMKKLDNTLFHKFILAMSNSILMLRPRGLHQSMEKNGGHVMQDLAGDWLKD